jgi:hypothetical protein
VKQGWQQDLQPLHVFLGRIPSTRRADRPLFGVTTDAQALQNPSALAHTNQNYFKMQQLEAEYETVMLRALNSAPVQGSQPGSKVRPNLQFYTCFDEREESFRRHIEALADRPTNIQTYGVSGFFNMEVDEDRLELTQRTRGYEDRKRLISELSLAYEKATFSPFGSVAISAALLPVSAGKLLLKSLSPAATVALEDAFSRAILPTSDTDFAPPFSPEEAAGRLAQLFRNIGTTWGNDFARLVLLTGHGASSVNNPLAAVYSCDSCSGNEAGLSAKAFARAANDRSVRAALRQRYDISIPADTWFVGGRRDTTTDLVELYDLESVPATHERELTRARSVLDRARAQNALERCSKFFLAGDIKTPEAALKHVRLRARDVAEPRPELGRATNAAVIVGRRELTKGRFLDRRASLPSYDPFLDDERGSNLETVLTPALLRGSAVSLEYLFSTVNGGAGTQAPMNVVGNFALQRGTSGDLLTGLATQMTELHSPQRALYLVR